MSIPKPARRAAVAATLIALFAVAACGSDGSSEAGTAPAASSSAPSDSVSTAPSSSPNAAPSKSAPAKSAPSPVTVPAALDFSAKTVSGDSFSGSSIAGKPVVLWFWAPWCAVCRSQAPQVSKLAADYGDDLAVIGIGSLDSGAAINGFAADVSGPLHLSDPEGKLWKKFQISEQSSFVVLDGAGKEILRTGYNDDDALTGTVEELVG